MSASGDRTIVLEVTGRWLLRQPLRIDRYRAEDFSLLVRWRRLTVRRGKTYLLH